MHSVAQASLKSSVLPQPPSEHLGLQVYATRPGILHFLASLRSLNLCVSVCKMGTVRTPTRMCYCMGKAWRGCSQ